MSDSRGNLNDRRCSSEGRGLSRDTPTHTCMQNTSMFVSCLCKGEYVPVLRYVFYHVTEAKVAAEDTPTEKQMEGLNP